MNWRDDLSVHELREILDRKIATTLTAAGAAGLHPSVSFVGAQPGASKSRDRGTARRRRRGAVLPTRG